MSISDTPYFVTPRPDTRPTPTLRQALGRILGARVLAEFGDDATRYADAKARRNYAGTALWVPDGRSAYVACAYSPIMPPIRSRRTIRLPGTAADGVRRSKRRRLSQRTVRAMRVVMIDILDQHRFHATTTEDEPPIK
jgi:hypothetical protein